MTTQTENTALLAWFQRQQTPTGWFDLLTIMIDAMVDNAGEAQSRPFLLQMGTNLAEHYPLSPATTVGELESVINRQLANFGWGFVDIKAENNALLLRHQAIPLARKVEQQRRWCSAFSAILEGVYARWIADQGGEAHVVISPEHVVSFSEIIFRYSNTQ